MDEESKLRRLQNIHVLHALSHDVLDKLARIAHEEEYGADHVLFEEGDEGDSLFFVIEGSAVIQKRLSTTPPLYKDVAVSEEGDIIGEMALFDGKPRSATVRARTPMYVLRIYRQEFEGFLKEDSISTAAILGELLSLQIGRLREAHQHNATLYQIVNIIASTRDVDALSREVMRRLMAALRDVDAGALCLWSPYHDECDVVFHEGVSAVDAPTLSIHRDGPIAKVLRSHAEPFVMSGIDASHPLHRVFTLSPRDSLLAAPLLCNDNLLGFILVARRGNDFTSFQRIVLATAAVPVASAILNMHHAQDIEARERLQTARTIGQQVSAAGRRQSL